MLSLALTRGSPELRLDNIGQKVGKDSYEVPLVCGAKPRPSLSFSRMLELSYNPVGPTEHDGSTRSGPWFELLGLRQSY